MTEPFVSAGTEPISPRYRVMNLISSAALGAFLASLALLVMVQSAVSITDNARDLIPLSFVVIACVTLFSCTYHWFADPLIRYAIRPQDVVLHKGLLFRSITCQPIKRIQHVEIKQGPIERFFGLTNLNIYSAGGSSHTFSIPGLASIQAQQLREYILEHADISEDH